MENVSVQNFAKEVFNLTDNAVYELLERFEVNQTLERSFTYTFVKALYIHSLKIYMTYKKKEE